MDGLCFSLYPIILVINLIFNDVICIYFPVSFYSIAFIANPYCMLKSNVRIEFYRKPSSV